MLVIVNQNHCRNDLFVFISGFPLSFWYRSTIKKWRLWKKNMSKFTFYWHIINMYLFTLWIKSINNLSQFYDRYCWTELSWKGTIFLYQIVALFATRVPQYLSLIFNQSLVGLLHIYNWNMKHFFCRGLIYSSILKVNMDPSLKKFPSHSWMFKRMKRMSRWGSVLVIISPLEFIAHSGGNRDHLHSRRTNQAAFNQWRLFLC